MHTRLLKPDLRTSQKHGYGRINIVYCCDASGSMKGKKLEMAKKAGIALMYKAINNKDKVFRMTQGEQLRDYMDIKDVVKVLYLLSQNVKHPDIINVASGEPISVRKLVENICRQRGANMKLELGYYPYSKFESMAFWADTTKLKKILAGRT